MDRMDAIAWTVSVCAGYLRLSQASNLERNWWRRPWAWCGVHWRSWADASQPTAALPPSTASSGWIDSWATGGSSQPRRCGGGEVAGPSPQEAAGQHRLGGRSSAALPGFGGEASGPVLAAAVGGGVACPRPRSSSPVVLQQPPRVLQPVHHRPNHAGETQVGGTPPDEPSPTGDPPCKLGIGQVQKTLTGLVGSDIVPSSLGTAPGRVGLAMRRCFQQARISGEAGNCPRGPSCTTGT